LVCDPDNIEVIVDPLQLEQALINLIQNAYDATDNIAQASLHIHAKLTHGARLSIEIIDNGTGISEEHLPHIFTPFFSTKEKGSGIGLALARQLIQNNNGTVRYAQSVGGGARFIITL
jgi:signal transduction histidine kinase